MAKPGYADQGFWVRLVFMAVYWAVLNISLSVFGIALIILTIIRFGSQFEPKSLTDFVASLSNFISQTLSFVCFQTEEKPYPFQPWPNAK
jgi:hypothetical protein